MKKIEVKDVPLAYIAGQIDCGSTFEIRETKGVTLIMVSIRRRDPWMLKIIKNRWGGHIRETKTAFDLTLTHDVAVKFLKEILEHLVVKAEQAQEIIGYYEEFNHSSPNEPGQ